MSESFWANNTDVPLFEVPPLLPNMPYEAVIYAINSKGRSSPRTLEGYTDDDVSQLLTGNITYSLFPFSGKKLKRPVN